MLEEYQDKRHINLNNLMDLFDEMAYEGHWRETLEFIAHAYKENSSVRSAMEGERNIQGFFTAYLSVNAYYLMAPEMGWRFSRRFSAAISTLRLTISAAKPSTRAKPPYSSGQAPRTGSK